MGTWGAGPFDNDAAADMIAKLMEPIHKLNGRKHTNDEPEMHYGEARAAAQFLLVSHGTDILGGHSLEPVLRALEHMRRDKSWIDSFRDPSEIMEALDKEIATVQKIVKTCCGLSDEERRKRQPGFKFVRRRKKYRKKRAKKKVRK